MSKQARPGIAKSGFAPVSRTVTADLEHVLEQYDHDYDQVPASLIHLGDHWSAIFNPNVARELNVELVKEFGPHQSFCPIMDVSFSPDGRHLASRSCGGAKIWNVQQDWQKIHDFPDSPTSDKGMFGGESEAVRFSPDSRLVATGGGGGDILIWDMESGSRKHRISGHDGGVRALAFSNDGKVLASSGGDQTVCLWDAESADLIKKFAVEGAVLDVNWSPDDSLLAASSGHDIIIWDAGTKSVLSRFETKSQGRSSLIASLVFSPNGKMLISGGFDGWIKVWSLEDGIPDNEALLLQLRGQEEVICSLAVTPDNRWLVSGSKNRDLLLWDLQSGDAQVLVSAFANSVTGVDVSTKGDLIATSCGDGTIRIFSYSPYASPEPEAAAKVYTHGSLRGFDMPLGHFPAHHFPIMTGNVGDWLSPTLSIRELCMLRFMDEITDKPDWWTKVHDAVIAGRWKAEALDAKWGSYRRYGDFTSAMADAVRLDSAYTRAPSVKEQDTNALIFSVSQSCVKRQNWCKHVVLYPPLTTLRLQGKGWHPGSDGKVLDLVHPSVCPLVYGQSRVLTPGQVVPRDSCVSMMGAGQVITDPGQAARKGVRAYNYFSTRFQWLPAEVLITNGKVKIDSYINNLHPQEHPGIYSIIETLIEKSLPAWDLVYRWPDEFAHQRLVVNQWWEQTHPLRLPNPADDGFTRGIKPEDIASSEYFLRRGKGAQRIQVIVKLANIHLSPEKPAYDGGSWHVEGLLNEHICATALFYYDNENITDSRLEFRSVANREDLTGDLDYAQNDFDSIKRAFGIDPEGSTMQDIGEISTRQGRAIFFPNILQHRVSPFRLKDASRPGHRKIVALFLVDPAIPIISTANVPPQQRDWWRNAEKDGGVGGGDVKGEGGSTLSKEGVADGLMDSEQASRIMEELMAERTMHQDKANHDLRELDWDFCEH
ncbi:Transcriptional repressor rco-1 [Beauveria bassiana]|nr:Transcriptional repressor rco-1 [Beauveria bassiana]